MSGRRRQTALVHTHLLTIDGEVVRKRFVSRAAGEADRERAGLTVLARHAPGLAAVRRPRRYDSREARVRLLGDAVGALPSG